MRLMKYVCLVCFTSLVVSTASSQHLEVLTYNIRLDVASDGENAWPNRKERLLAFVESMQPDIFGVQEAQPHQVDALTQHFRPYTKIGIGREGMNKGEASCLFLRSDRFTVLDSGTFWLSPTPDTISIGWDAACLRVCTWAKVTDLFNKQTYLVANTHLDHIGQLARQNSLSLILKRLEKASEHWKLPVIFMGDLNTEPNDPIMSGLTQQLTDSRSNALERYGTEGTFNGFIFDKTELKRIDYVFVSPNSFEVSRYGALNNSWHGRYPSDHFPVIVRLRPNSKKE